LGTWGRELARPRIREWGEGKWESEKEMKKKEEWLENQPEEVTELRETTAVDESTQSQETFP
jgi:hypothetical protein